MQNLDDIEQYLTEMLENGLAELREKLTQQLVELLQEVADNAPTALENTYEGSTQLVSLWDKTAAPLSDLGTFAALSAFLPLPATQARLPQPLQGGAVFRPALRRLGALAGKSAASVIFDSSQGAIGYSNRQFGQRLLQGLLAGK